MANKRDSQHHQQNQHQKKTSTDCKKSTENYDSSAAPSSTTPSDVYEFVSTPKHSSCSSGSGDENPSKVSEKSSEDKSGTDSETSVSANFLQKRVIGDQPEPVDANDEDTKKKKRADSELKEGQKVSTGVNKVTPRIGQKPPGPASKTMILTNKSTSNSVAETKSPCELTKKTQESEDDNDDEGPKVPPLKIVIPQQLPGTSDTQETQNISHRVTNKTATSRNHPYVVASSNSNDGTGSDGVTGGRCQSPAESNKSDDTSRSQGKSKEPRILRSSRKDAKDDRGSNNSSPQLPASSTPSPAAQNTEASTGNDSENQQNSASTSSASSSSGITQTSTTVATSTSSIQNSSQVTQLLNPVELHPRKRKIKASSREPVAIATSSNADVKDSNSKDGQEKSESVHPHDQPFTNCYQMYIDLRKQIEQRHRSLRPVEPRPLKGLEDYLMNRRTYLLQGKNSLEPNIIIPPLLPPQMKEIFTEQEKERHKLKLRHIVEKEKLVLSKEQEILRVHCKAAQMQANQSTPFSVCTILKDEEVYNSITPEHEERYNNRSFFKELKDLDDKYDKIKVRIYFLFISFYYR